MENYRLIPAIRSTDKGNERVQAVHQKTHSARRTITLEPDTLDAFLRYEVSNYTEHDPFRPMGRFDSWAGKPKPK